MIGNAFITLLYYAVIYIAIFISMFWFVIFFSNKKRIMKAPETRADFPSISLIIPAYNEEVSILKSIKSALGSDYPKDRIEIVVVDDASTDRTCERVKEFMKTHKNVRLIRHKENRRKAAALNTALATINTDIVGFLDADTALEKNSLKNMVGYLKDRKIGGVIAHIQPQECRNMLQRLQKTEYLMASILRKLLTFVNSLYITPAFALYRTGLVKRLGGWDEKNISEDLEMGMKLQSQGYKIETCMKAKVFTKTPDTLKKLWMQRVRWYRGLIYNSKKYKNMFFNRKFGDLGMFVLPLNYIVIGLTMFMFFYGLSSLAWDSFNAATNLYSIGFDWQYMLSNARFNLNTPVLIFMATMITGFVAMIKLGKGYVKESLWKLDYAAYIALYPLMHLFFWMTVIYYEIRRKDLQW